MKNFLPALLVLLLAVGCKKPLLTIAVSTGAKQTTATGFQAYTILAGNHYAEGNAYRSVELQSLKFTVRFDSSAIYTTKDPDNQYDINKLFGFSDNGAQHHEHSARVGWRWSDGALRLFAYAYNGGKRFSQEIGAVPIGLPIACSILVKPQAYVFVVGEKTVTLPRGAAAPTAKGYQLYPYFGGDEPAPHDVRIWIREEN